MVPAFGTVCLPPNPCTGNGQVPGCSFILSVATVRLAAACTGRCETCDPKEGCSPISDERAQLVWCDFVSDLGPPCIEGS